MADEETKDSFSELKLKNKINLNRLTVGKIKNRFLKSKPKNKTLTA